MSGNASKPASSPSAEAYQAQLIQAIVDVIPAHIAVLDPQGVIQAVNPSWRRFALENAATPGSFPPGCDVGADYLAICDAAQGNAAEGAAAAAAGIRAVLAGQRREFSLEYPCHSPEVRRWFMLWVAPVARPESGVVVVHVDITARKLAEMAARENALRLELALEASGNGLWDWDLQTNQAYLSPGYYAMTGYRPGEVTAGFDFFHSLVHPEDWSQVEATMQAHLRGEIPDSLIEYRMLTRSGEARWTQGRGRVMERDDAGRPLRMMGLISDIQREKILETRLRASEAAYRTVVEDQTELISRFLPDGTILFVNEVYRRLFGKAPEEMVGQRWQPEVHPDDLGMIEARLGEITPEHPVVQVENRVRVAGGKMLWMQFVNRGFFDDSGRLVELQSVGRDITQRKALEQEREALLEENTRLGQEMIRLQEIERTRLAQELHDELSQQLVAVRAHAAALRLRAGAEDAQARADAAAIEAAAGHIYDVSHRIMEGLHPQALECAGLDQALAALASDWRLRNPDTRLKVHVAGSLGIADIETGIHLYRVAQECLSNLAAHAQAARARLWLGLGGRDGQPWVRLVCRDNGRGMNPDAPRRGYGLLMMRERARALGGRFDLQSQPGRGVRVLVEVPLARTF